MKFLVQTILSAILAVVILFFSASVLDMISGSEQVSRAISPPDHVMLPMELQHNSLDQLPDGVPGWVKPSAMRVDKRGKCWVFLQSDYHAQPTFDAQIEITRHGNFFMVALPSNWRDLGIGWKPVDLFPVLGQYAAVTELQIAPKSVK